MVGEAIKIPKSINLKRDRPSDLTLKIAEGKEHLALYSLRLDGVEHLYEQVAARSPIIRHIGAIDENPRCIPQRGAYEVV